MSADDTAGEAAKAATKKKTSKRKKGKDPAAVKLGLKGGSKGGKARAAKMTPKERSEAARRAVQARWGQEPSLAAPASAFESEPESP